MAIPPHFIQALTDRVDIVEIVGRHVQLRKGGANLMGLCPFHGEKSPSFSVSPTKQFYHCFGCGKNGNAISFLMDFVGMTFIEAVRDLAEQSGMQVPEDDASPEQRRQAAQDLQKRSTLTEVLEKAAKAYQQQLKAAPHAIDYLKKRGLSGAIAKTYGIGYATESWHGLSSVFANYTDPLLVESGMVILSQEDTASAAGAEERRWDRFRDRVMFPIRNIKGECIGFGGRVMGSHGSHKDDGKGPKYLNSPETPVFSKGRELYGLYEARDAVRKAGYALVTEGYMDVVALAQAGLGQAVATLGTACTADHLQKLFRFTDSVVFSFDGDPPGRKAARKALDVALPFATDVRSVKFLFLPPEHDPDSFIREKGHEAFAAYVANAVPLSRFLLDAVKEGCEILTAEGRAKMASHAKPLWMSMPEGALKRQMLGELTELTQLTDRELLDIWEPPYQRSVRTGATQRQEGAGGHKKYDFDSKEHNNSIRRGTDSPMRSVGRPGRPVRLKIAQREDHAVRLLLTWPAAWETLSNEEHALLCHLPPPHGQLFAWLEGEQLNNGPLPWGVLSQQIVGQPFEDLAHQVMTTPPTDGPQDEAAQELRDVIQRLMLVDLEQEQNRLAMQMETDPTAMVRYRELAERRKRLTV